MLITDRFGAALAAARRTADLSQYELADKADVTRRTLDNAERGVALPQPAELLRIGEALGADIPALLREAGATPSEISVLTGAGGEPEAGDALVSVAPALSPNALDAAAKSLAKHGIDISAIVELARYLSGDAVAALLTDANYDALNPEMLEHLMPLLDAASKEIVFQKILDGELDWHLIACMLPYSEYLIQQVEAAVVYGVLDEGALKLLNDYLWKRDEGTKRK